MYAEANGKEEKTFGAHLAHIWRTFGAHLAHIWRTFGAHFVHIWRTYATHMARIWRTNSAHMTRTYVAHLWRTCGAHLAHGKDAGGVRHSIEEEQKKLCTLLDLCVSSLRRGHANLLCIVPILTDDPRRESTGRGAHWQASISG